MGMLICNTSHNSR